MEHRMSYMYGSTAPKLPQVPERQQVHQSGKSRPRASKAAAPAYAHVPKAKMIFCIIALAIMGFIVLYRFSVLADMNAAMSRMNEEYNALRNENRLLRVEIETSIDLDKVKQVAETELGMHKPDRFQVIPVSVPKNNYNVVLDQQYIDQAADGNEKPLLEGILDTIKAAFP